MACNGQNILKNGNFTSRFHHWRKKGSRLVTNPMAEGDISVAMGPGSLIHQVVKGPFNWQCAYYLRFRVMNSSPSGVTTRVVANVAYLGPQKQLLGQTPLTVDPPHREPKRFSSYFTIVPPPPHATKYMVVAFSVKSGSVLVDTISVSSHKIEMKLEEESSGV